MIFLCLLKGTSVANPYSTTPGHSTLAPWMGENTRVGNILPKTEVKKALKRKPDDIKHPAKKMNEDIILEIIESKKVYVVLIYCWFYISGLSVNCDFSIAVHVMLLSVLYLCVSVWYKMLHDTMCVSCNLNVSSIYSRKKRNSRMLVMPLVCLQRGPLQTWWTGLRNC